MTRHLPRLFWQHVVRDVTRHRLLAVLNVLSIALGVAVYLAIQIANENANRAFAASVDLVAGRAHLEIRGAVPETLWPTIRALPEVEAVTGVVEGIATLPDHPGEYVRILGVDPFSNEPFLTFPMSPGDTRLDLEAWLRSDDGVVLEQSVAARLKLKPGDRVRLLVNSRVHERRLLWTVDLSDSLASAEQRVAAMDIGWAQELLGKQGVVTSLQLRLKDPQRSEEVAEKINALLPADLRAEAPRQRSQQLQNMVSAFRLNLTALSMVSLLVGVFLVYNTISATVARRRREIGILRAVGASRKEVRALFLGEACLFGVIGVALGLAAGVALSTVLSGAVAQTISALYVLVSIGHGAVPPLQIAVAALFGMAAVIAGAWLPADEAARVDPVQTLSLAGRSGESTGVRVPWALIGAAMMLLAAALCGLALTTGLAWLAFAGAFCVLSGWAMFAPRAIVATSRMALATFHGSSTFLWRLAADHLARSVHRNGITVAALTIAFAMMTGLTVMIHSFRESVGAWVEGGIVADLFIAPASNEVIGLGATIPDEAIRWLREQPEIDSVDTFREQQIAIEGRNGKDQRALLAVVGGRYRENLQISEGEVASV
ncbi:MAG: ABC transporter permease, partial [Chthoniobacteraceae bacterium]